MYRAYSGILVLIFAFLLVILSYIVALDAIVNFIITSLEVIPLFVACWNEDHRTSQNYSGPNQPIASAGSRD
jgi:uncharacterized membrane protein